MKVKVMGPGQNLLTQVGLGQFFVARVRTDQPSFVWDWVWKNSPQKISSGRVKKYPGQRRSQPLFTVSRKYAQVGSGPISTQIPVKKRHQITRCPIALTDT